MRKKDSRVVIFACNMSNWKTLDVFSEISLGVETKENLGSTSYNIELNLFGFKLLKVRIR